MQKKPKVSLRPVVDAISDLLKELDNLEDARDAKSEQRTKALKATLEGASLMLRSECWSSDANEAVYEFPA
jgi:molecular chaperone GrpE (heat shock protein)